MPQIKFHKPYKFAHDGHRVEEFEPGDEPVDTTDECAEQAIKDGAAKAVRAPRAKADTKPDRTELDAALAALPGDHTDPDYVVTGMRGHFGDVFTEADEAHVRSLVKKPD